MATRSWTQNIMKVIVCLSIPCLILKLSYYSPSVSTPDSLRLMSASSQLSNAKIRKLDITKTSYRGNVVITKTQNSVWESVSINKSFHENDQHLHRRSSVKFRNTNVDRVSDLRVAQGHETDEVVSQRILSGDIIIPQPHVSQVSCQILFSNTKLSSAENRRLRHLKASHRYRDGFYGNDKLQVLLTNCDNYFNQRPYIASPILPEEKSFPIAYSLVVHHQASMVERLLRAVYRPQNIYCIHVDAKSTDQFHNTMIKLSQCFPNVFVAQERAVVHWGYIGVLQAELICMKELLRYKHWKYFMNLCGGEFPLKTNLDLVQILKAYNGANEVSNLPSRQYSGRWKYVHNHIEYRTNRTKAPPPHNITIRKGDVHVVLSRDFVRFATEDARVGDFVEWLDDVFCPEEFFFSSLQYNPHLKAPGSRKAGTRVRITGTTLSRHKLWQHDREICHGRYVRNICVFNSYDLPYIIKDDKAFFVNKLGQHVDPVAVDCLEELLFNRTYDDYVNGRRERNLDFDKNLDFVKNHQ